MKKEELIKELARVTKRLEDYQDKDETARKYMSKFLGSYEPKELYNFNESREVKALDWAEIFFKVGERFAQKIELEEMAGIKQELTYLTNEHRNIVLPKLEELTNKPTL